jgi:hypothetical protein
MSFNSILSNFVRGDEGGRTGNTVQIGDNYFLFNVFLWNGETKTGLTFSSIEDFKIVDDLRYFYSYGYIVINDSSEVLENFNGIDGKGKIIPYNFRGDGRDYLEVEIMPQMNPNDNCMSTLSESERKEFCLRYTFSIYKIEEDLKEVKGVKHKKLFFWDKDYQLLTEIDSRFTTSEVPLDGETNSLLGLGSLFQSSTITPNDPKGVKNTDDFKRYTGDCIKYLLKKTLNLTGFRASSTEWDKGGGLIEHHTNGEYKAIHDLQYLIDYHVSTKDYDFVPCILKKTRYTDEYTLVPITVYTQNATYNSGGILGAIAKKLGGKELTEDFFLGKLDTSGSGLGNNLRFGSITSPNSFNAVNYNIVENYSFIKPEADMMQEDVSTHFVHSFDPHGGFTCSIGTNNIKSQKKSIFNDSIKNLPTFGTSKNFDTIPVNQLRENNQNVKHVFETGLGINQNFQKLNFGRNKALMASIFKNTAIYFKIKGLTRRKSGTFFNLNRTDNRLATDHDKMVLGTYFTTMVIHEFKEGSYHNHIYATKPAASAEHKFAKMR